MHTYIAPCLKIKDFSLNLQFVVLSVFNQKDSYPCRYHMAQPAGFLSQNNRNDMDIPVFWTSANSDQPWNFQISFDQFLLPVTENVNPDILMEDPP